MCTSYESNNPKEAFDVFSLFPRPEFDYKPEIYKDYFGPIFRGTDDGFETVAASFGIVPRYRIPKGVRPYDTMNARTESIAERRSFSAAWNHLQFCLIPCRSFFEPCYETGKAVRWHIRLADAPTAIAGLWRAWEQADGMPTLSFTMLTVNADEHCLMRRFHKPGEEKRSVVIVRPDAYADWLSCKSADEARSFLHLYPADEMFAEPFPLPPRAPKSKPNGGEQQSMLD
ncbi:hypothetical protein WQE_15351 [Paraburkholderia hospita]|uniref:Abasic site processing protein n=1 Tax=Paraburkholderia hospita TaxID=169430 RepID=A0ABN0FNS3_9BURK|nr:SOS response-associated peptidase family protein [Paraburkholderia hospita]EIN00419.1 hypothetical protein WQE_15351 [Paraburkholderia hospita]OUL88432.1 DUF159 family protein [Paraburkholderia hospita]